ncbi:Phosphomannomutase [Pseudomonas syringae pv. actinidiae]|uniref:Phosphomannomutase n=1 Tax=Pseudomonas syringae pv. actinidiae TaxID=103796 RepID=A0AAN4Q1A8_PSESF|nr:Phosphomannomutase [Pseudomonas syringae pv. actinidiae]
MVGSALLIRNDGHQPALAAIAVTSTRMPSTANDATPTAARTGHGFLKKRLYTSLNAARSAMSVR